MKELMIALQTMQQGQKQPFYEQIYAAFRREIEEGRISCGEKLPSTRLLAANLNVSRFTVNLAYEQLVSEGYVQAKGGSGFFVCDLSDLFGAQMSAPNAPAAVAVCEEEPCLLDFSPFAVDAAHFPYNCWKKCSKAALEEQEKLLIARDAAGDGKLRETIATYLYRARGVCCTPEQVLVGAGHEYLLLLCAQLIGCKKTVVMENPTYMQAYQVFTHAGWDVRVGASDGEGLRCATAEAQAADIAYVMPSHQFPLGTVMPLGRRQELLEWAAARDGRYIIEDDHDSEFRYVGKPIPSLQSRDRDARVIYFGSFSKSISPGLRIGYVVLPRHLSERFRAAFGFYSSTVSTQQQRTVCHFMQTGDFERHLNRMRRIYRAKHDFLLRELKKRAWVREIRGENAGLHLVVTVQTALTEAELLQKAQMRGVKLYGMKSCQITEAIGAPLMLLLGFGGLREEQILQGLRILDTIV